MMHTVPEVPSRDSTASVTYDDARQPAHAANFFNGTVPPRPPYAVRRPREYLSRKEIERLIAAAKRRERRYSLRGATMILVAYRHGLRLSELCGLVCDQIDLAHGLMHVRRLKNGMPSVRLIGGDKLRALRSLRRGEDGGRFVFMSERGATIPGSPQLAGRIKKFGARCFGIALIEGEALALPRRSSGGVAS